MRVNSYLFQSPYSQPVQVGRPDPMAKEQKVELTSQNPVQELKSTVPEQAKIKPTLDSGVSINITALAGSEGQKAVDTFNNANIKVQAQSTYQNS
ncbi:MAG: hypothetical protein PHI47_00155 [Sulfuricurvum sp.]|uniref:hypothetical protein n=1 Tax=Sulfuricurvum sp. TaxID=2025608 RepID=UPI0026019E0A|nr:hypothetical protein [Sulfuricurvum sp.]MDD5158435.1 hypothetical protein [Sulfuricurvum sp.]